MLISEGEARSVDLGTPDANLKYDVYVRDVAAATTTRVSVGLSGAEPNGHSTAPQISADGTTVAFQSSASNLAVGDTNNSFFGGVFRRQLSASHIEMIDVSTSGVLANFFASNELSVTADGSTVAFASSATNLVVPDANASTRDVYVRTLTLTTVEFVERNGTELVLAGEPFRFTGMNIYHATSDGWCNDAMSTGSALSDALTEMNDPHVMRTWFFQMMGTSPLGVRDWSALDHALQVARDHGVKVIATLGNQWADCDSQRGEPGEYKNASWYTGRYKTEVPPGLVSTYREWVAEVVDRYKDDPTILAWELVNEPELPKVGDVCPAGSGDILHNFAADVSALVKSIDPNHLVSLGTIGGGQCGTAEDDYTLVHSPPGIDLCSVHDYDQPAYAVPGDQWNGMAVRLQQCEALDKPVFVGEAGLTIPQSGGSATQRADLLVRKMSTALRAGAVGHVLWAWDAAPHDFQPGDPVFSSLGLAASVWPDDGGDSDLDGISSAVDVAAGFADGNGTSGSILPNQNLRAVILDAPAPAGVSIYVPSAGAPQPLQVALCGQPVTVMTGTEATLTCGSVIANVATGTVMVPLRDGSVVTIPGGTKATVNERPDGSFTVSDVAGAGVTLTAAGTVHPLTAGAPSRTFDLWQFTGFASPYAGPGPHPANAGGTVKLKFTIRKPSGTPVTSLQRVTIRVETKTPCAAGGPTPNGAPVTVALRSGLTHLGSGQYTVDWKTAKSYARSCKLMRLDLGEGITHDTSFIFTK